MHLGNGLVDGHKTVLFEQFIHLMPVELEHLQPVPRLPICPPVLEVVPEVEPEVEVEEPRGQYNCCMQSPPISLSQQPGVSPKRHLLNGCVGGQRTVLQLVHDIPV